MVDPIPPQFQTIAAQAELQKIKRSRGRPAGAKNYSGVSLIARSMKEKGIYWVYELIDAYKLYQKQLELYVKDPTRSQPDGQLLRFWMEILPYITVKMIDRETRRERPAKKYPRKISHNAIKQLAEAEGRDL